jgi:leucyl aminopeptidase
MKVSSKKGQAHTQVSDLLVVPVFASKKLSGQAASLDKKMLGWLKQSAREKSFEGKPGQSVMVHAHDTVKPNRVMLVGVGSKKEATLEEVRRAAGLAVNAANGLKVKKMTADVSDLLGVFKPEELAAAFAEGAQLANYSFDTYKGETAERVATLLLVGSTDARVSKYTSGVRTAKLTTAATLYARDLVNEPAINMKPSTLAAQARKLGKQTGVTTKVYNEKWIKEKKMGAILAVSAGSEEQPYLVHMKYTPRKKAKKSIAICGKGITFDSGGISLKPTGYIENMKMDMAGAASVLALFSQITKLTPDVEVHGIFVAAENMPSGRATRPGDVITSYSGKTVEVTNTDAEGRLILCDALAWAEKTLKPDMIVDIATLTGAAIVALGQEVAAVFGDDDTLVKAYMDATEETGEAHWRMPLTQEYAQLLKSPIADCQNSPRTSWAGATIGALYLHQFIEKTPWMHIDIAGPAWAEKQMLPYAPVGATGFCVRSLMHMVKSL